MDARPRPDARDDAELVRAATAGDRGAFAAIYDRYADRLHDFCWSVLRDRDEAADATQDAFLVAAERLGQLRDPERLRPWLYAVARSQALRRVRARSRVAPEEEMTELPDPATGPEQAAERSDLRELVWNAAAGLSERDRALLDLHLRHGLEGAELGQAMGFEPGHAYVLLSRLRDQVERSLGALLVARLGRDDCPDLAAILSGWDGRFTPLIRKRVARHVDACDVCSERRRTAASPLALLAAVPPMPAPAFLRDRVLERVELLSGSGSGGDAGDAGGPGGEGSGGSGGGSPVAAAVVAPQPDPPAAGPPEGESSRLAGSGGSGIHSPRRRGAVVALVAALLLAAGVGVGLGWERAPASSPTNGQGGPIVAGAATSVAPTSTPTTAAPSTTTSSSTSVTTTTAAPVAAVAGRHPGQGRPGGRRRDRQPDRPQRRRRAALLDGRPLDRLAAGQPVHRPSRRRRAGQGHAVRDPRRPARRRRRRPGRAHLGRPRPLGRGRAPGRAPPRDRRHLGLPRPGLRRALHPKDPDHHAGPGNGDR